MNKWRKVQYADDGCEEYQCLSCKDTFVSRTSCGEYGYKFCPLCGIKWEGEEVWDDNIQYFTLEKQETKAYKEPVWVIESRSRFKTDRDDWGEWEIDMAIGYTNALSVYNDIDFCKSQNGLLGRNSMWEVEYRVRILREDDEALKYLSHRGFRTNRNVVPDYSYYKEYQEKWGGKLHHAKTERKWMHKTSR